METRLAEPHPTDVWVSALVAGTVVMLIGVLALVFSVWTSLATVLLLGAALLVGGVLQLVHGFQLRRSRSGVVQLLSGILALVIGIMFFFRPVEGLHIVTLLLIGLFFADGLFLCITAIANREEAWGWQLASGAVSIALGIVLAVEWPYSAVWLVGLVIGINLITRGALLIVGSFRLRRALEAGAGSARA